jgi:predicted CopG family antitoxin
MNPRVIEGGATMQKKLTIMVDESVYEGLHAVVGRRRISRFIEELVRLRISGEHLGTAYRDMARMEKRESEALHWAEGTVGDIADDTR